MFCKPGREETTCTPQAGLALGIPGWGWCPDPIAVLQRLPSGPRAPSAAAAAALSTLPAPLLHSCSLALELLLESWITQTATPFSSLRMSIVVALGCFTVRMHLFPGLLIPSKSLTVTQCNQILKLKLESLDTYLNTHSPEILLLYTFFFFNSLNSQEHFSGLWSPLACPLKGSLLPFL